MSSDNPLSPYENCVKALKRGACIAYPTEAVWGLGCDPLNENAVSEILRMKQRPIEKGLILIASNIQQFEFLLNDLPEPVLDKMKSRWPGHVTWLVPHRKRVKEFISGDSDKVAIRVSAHSTVQGLCNTYGAAIVSTSANPAGLPAATSENETRSYFKDEQALIYAAGELGSESRPSTIIDASDGKILRA